MAPVTKASLSIVRCSSQDAGNRCENILATGNDKKWLSNSQDSSRRIEAEIHIAKDIKIGYINIGNAGSAFVELLVGSSMWPSGKEYITLLPSMMLLSPADSKSGKNNNAVKMLDNAQFSKGVSEHEWDRLQVICTQPFTKEKFGLKFVDIIEDDKLANQETSRGTEKAKTTPSRSLAKFRSKLQVASSPSSRSESPRSPSIAFGHLSSPTSSRSAGLVRAALNGQVKPKQVMQEKNHQRQRHTNKPKRSTPYPAVDAQLQSQRRKSLSRRTAGDIEDEVECFLEAYHLDKMPLEEFTYQNLLDEMEEMRGSKLDKQEKKIFKRLAAKAVQAVLDKREGPQQLEESIFGNASFDNVSSPKSSKTCIPSSSPSPPPLSLTPPSVFPTPPPKTPANTLHECPICERFFSQATIEFHASTCVAPTHETVVVTSPMRDSDVEEMQMLSPVKAPCHGDLESSNPVLCPLCDRWYAASRVNLHANFCDGAGRLTSTTS